MSRDNVRSEHEKQIVWIGEDRSILIFRRFFLCDFDRYGITRDVVIWDAREKIRNSMSI